MSVTSSAAQKRALRADGDTHLISPFGVLAETCEQGGVLGGAAGGGAQCGEGAGTHPGRSRRASSWLGRHTSTPKLVHTVTSCCKKL